MVLVFVVGFLQTVAAVHNPQTSPAGASPPGEVSKGKVLTQEEYYEICKSWGHAHCSCGGSAKNKKVDKKQ